MTNESGALLGTAAVIVWNDIAPEGREQFYRWHDKEHIPERLAVPGFLRGRRYARRGHSPEWLTFYEATDLDVLTSPGYLARLNSPTPQTTSTLTFFRNTSRAVCRVAASVGSSSGGFVLALRLDAGLADAEAVRSIVGDQLFAQAIVETGVLACHLYAADPSASFTDTAESRTRAFDVPSWVVLIESSTPEAAERARSSLEGPEVQRLALRFRPDSGVYALEICRLSTKGMTSS